MLYSLLKKTSIYEGEISIFHKVIPEKPVHARGAVYSNDAEKELNH